MSVVVVCDTQLIQCVIEYSLDEKFKIYRSLRDKRIISVNGSTHNSKIKWETNGFDYLDSGKTTTVGRNVLLAIGPRDSIDVTELINIPAMDRN